MAKVLNIICITLLIIVTCTGCNNDKYTVKEYLDDLAYETGLVDDTTINNSFSLLQKWGVIKEEDINILDSELTYDYLVKTISNLINENWSIEYFKSKSWIDKNVDIDGYVTRSKARDVICLAVDYINNPIISNEYNYELVDDSIDINTSIEENKSFEEIYKSFEISGNDEINFDKAEIEYYGQEVSDTSYINNKYKLLSSNKTKVFNLNGYRISYRFTSSSITAHISKDVKDGINGYFDISLSNIKPSYKWKYKDGNVETSFFKVSYNSAEKLGISTGKYKRLYVDYNGANKTDVKSFIQTILKKKEDKLETSFTICTIKTPIPNVPTASIDIDVLVNLYASGKTEIVLSSKATLGFEIKNGQTRVIKEIDRDCDFIIKGTTKATAGVNISLNSTNKRLMDIESDVGIQGNVQTTLHIFDKDGKLSSQKTEEAYSILDDAFEGSEDVKVCGDLSLHWVLDLKLNTSKSLLYKLGFSYEKELLDDDDQVFGNLHHIENGHFVEKCTRKAKNKQTITKVKSDVNKIILDKYSVVMKKGETYVISPVLPNGYTMDDLLYENPNNNSVAITNNVITAKASGNSKIRIYTKDKKYETYLNILVSYEE